VEAVVTLVDGTQASAIAPAGASTGSGEARELRDGGTALKGLGVKAAIEATHQILAPAIVGMDITDQAGIDQAMQAADGTPDKSRVGGNSMIAVSLACLWAASKQAGQPLWQYLRADNVAARPGWEGVNAVKNKQLFEIKSPDILQPGPAALTDGVAHMHRIVMAWMDTHGTSPQ
jgi:enolase